MAVNLNGSVGTAGVPIIRTSPLPAPIQNTRPPSAQLTVTQPPPATSAGTGAPSSITDPNTPANKAFIAWLTQVYQSLLGRAPEPAAIQNALIAVNTGSETSQQIVDKIKASPEFLQRNPAQTPPPQPPPSAPSSGGSAPPTGGPVAGNAASFANWFTGIYQKFLGRNPSAADLQNALTSWNFFNSKGGDTTTGGTGLQAGTGVGELAGGQDLADIAYKIAISPEAATRNQFANGLNPTTALALINQDYQQNLNRAPETEAIENALVALLGGYETPAQLLGGIQSSPEYLKLHPPQPPTQLPPPPPPPIIGGTPPPPPPPGPGPVEPGLVRFQGLSEFDPNYAQNMAVATGGQLQRPVNMLAFNPFSNNPFSGPGFGSLPSGGGNDPIVGNPPTLQQNAFANAGGAAPPPGQGAIPNSTPAPGTPNAGLTLGSPTSGIPTAPRPGQGAGPAPALTSPLPAASTSPTTTGSAANLSQQVQNNLFTPGAGINMPGL